MGRNPDRASRVTAAGFALDHYRASKGEVSIKSDEVVIDLLTDLRHYCDAHGYDFEECDGIANAHYLIER